MNFDFNALGLSHKFMSEHLRPGDVCIDATAGRGRDTLFLARLVGEKGKVLAFDIQKEALESTKRLLSENGVNHVSLFLCCHSKMDEFAEPESIDGIMFNFGYLPGGDRTKFSQSKTSVCAIQKGLSLLKKGGVMTLCLYYGKENGMQEKDDILAFLKTVDPKSFSVLYTDFINRTGCPPLCVLIQKD